jgi:hypothetical protein
MPGIGTMELSDDRGGHSIFHTASIHGGRAVRSERTEKKKEEKKE